jgi:hypothetical protein
MMPVLFSVLIAFNGPSGAQEASDSPAQGQSSQAGGAPSAAEMEAWLKYSTPGEGHKVLEPLAGEWTTASQMWMQPGAPPMTSTGQSTTQWVLGGRFLQQNYKGDMMGQPFEGLGFLGYDIYKQKYTSVWMDSAGTMTVVGYGTYDPAQKTLTITGEMDDVVKGKATPYRMVYRDMTADGHVLEMYSSDSDGKEFKAFEMVHTRRKGA